MKQILKLLHRKSSIDHKDCHKEKLAKRGRGEAREGATLGGGRTWVGRGGVEGWWVSCEFDLGRC